MDFTGNPFADMDLSGGQMGDMSQQFNPMQGDMGMPMQGYGMPGVPGMPMQGDIGMPMQGYGMPGVPGMPMQMGYGMPTGVYGAPQQFGGNPYGGGFMGRVDQAGFVHYSRGQMLEGLRNYVINCNQGRVMVNKVEKLDETPPMLRHACADCGVSFLQMLTFQIPEAGIQIPFYFCTACGKLFYYKDFC